MPGFCVKRGAQVHNKPVPADRVLTFLAKYSIFIIGFGKGDAPTPAFRQEGAGVLCARLFPVVNSFRGQRMVIAKEVRVMRLIVSLLVVVALTVMIPGGPSCAAENEPNSLVASDLRSSTSFHVDGVNGGNNNDGLTREQAFATIQKAVDLAKDGDTVLVWPGTYIGAISFKGKAITVKSTADPATLKAPGEFAVSFAAGEGPASVLRNFIIADSRMAVFVAGASPSITNVTVVHNEYGIGAYGRCQPNITSSIFWKNTNGDLFQCRARYSCLADGGEGQGNINLDPLFVDPNNNDYHLRSERGRYWPRHNVWVLDDVTSACVDGGDPAADCSGERKPNGGRVDMGAYGDSAYASMSEPAPLR